MKKRLFASIASQIRKRPGLVALFNKLGKVASVISPETVAVLNYPLILKQRWPLEHPHQLLHDIIDRNRNKYASRLHEFLSLTKYFNSIPVQPRDSSSEPSWINGWMPALDGIALYSYLVIYKPKIYLEVGSGNSTKFARKAIKDHNLDTRIISIDPCPRAEINSLCDEFIRKPVEEVDLKIFDRLEANDILYVDGSHRVFMNSDATMIFLDVFPKLKPGVLVEIHDITLPYDYPGDYIRRYYSEQYLLAAYLLAEGNTFDIILPSYFVSHDKELKNVMAPFLERDEMKDAKTHGSSFWLMKK